MFTLSLFSKVAHRVCLSGVIAASVLLSFAPTAQAKPGDTKKFVILHSNDQHGHLLPFSYPDSFKPGYSNAGDEVARMPFHKNIGGIARRATLVKEIRKNNKNVYLFDGGDCMDGSAFSVEYSAQADYAAMNAVGYDYSVFGNHDFNMTPQQFTTLKGMAKFTQVLANVTETTTGKTPLPPYVMADWNGLKVAIFGLVTYDVRTYTAVTQTPYTVTDPLVVAKTLVPELRKKADLVVAVTHIGLDKDIEMARTIPGIDIIVGAHSHTRLPVGVYQVADNPGGSDPLGTIILQDHQWVGELGRLDVTVAEGNDGKWHVTQYSEQLIPITDKIKEDKTVAGVVASYWDKIKEKYSVVLGIAKADIMEPDNYHLVADAIQFQTRSQFDLENRGGVRIPLMAGPVTFEDMVELDPFTNTVYTFSIKGSELKKLLADQRPYPSKSLQYSVRKRADRGWDFVSGTIDGKPIEDDTVYNGSTNSYLIGIIKNRLIDSKDLMTPRRDVIINYVKTQSPIAPDSATRADFGGTDPYQR